MTVAIPCQALRVPVALVMASWASIVLAQNAPDAEAHKAWMNDASDAQEDFRAALSDKDAKAASEALTRIERLMAQTEAYWSERKMTDGVKLAREARTLATAGAALAKTGKLPEANDSFGRMNSTCNACHELHLERR